MATSKEQAPDEKEPSESKSSAAEERAAAVTAQHTQGEYETVHPDRNRELARRYTNLARCLHEKINTHKPDFGRRFINAPSLDLTLNLTKDIAKQEEIIISSIETEEFSKEKFDYLLKIIKMEAENIYIGNVNLNNKAETENYLFISFYSFALKKKDEFEVAANPQNAFDTKLGALVAELAGLSETELDQMSSFLRILKHESARAQLPDKPTVPWPGGRKTHLTPVEFVRHHYSDYIGILTQADLKRIDEPLYKALNNWLTRSNTRDEVREWLPTLSDQNDDALPGMTPALEATERLGAVYRERERRIAEPSL